MHPTPMNLKSLPQRLLLVFVLLFAILSIATKNRYIDIYLHDTNYIIPGKDLFLGSSLLLFFSWILTFLIQKLAVPKLFIWIPVILTILSLSMFLAISLNYTLTGSDLETNRTIMSVQQFSMLLFIIAQILFIVNMVIGIIKTFKKRRIEG